MIVRERTAPLAARSRRPYEVVVMMNDEPVLLCRRRLCLPDDWEHRSHHFNAWQTVDPPATWVEPCESLERAWAIADERSKVLNKLAHLFDADTAVSLYKRWEGDIR
ncbi:MAG: hypothetical protein ACRD2W_10060 [Acidimicrobiales bacterium]